MPQGGTGRRTGKKVYLQERDDQILAQLLVCDLLSLNQIDRVFFAGRGGSWPRERMGELEKVGLVKRLRGKAAQFVPPGEWVYILTQQGAERVVHAQSQTLADVEWKPYKRTTLIPHDLRLADVRLAIEQAVTDDPSLSLFEWWPERVFRADPDTVAYTDPVSQAERKRRIIPDGYFVIRQQVKPDSRTAREFAYLLELDMSTEHNPRFGRQKVVPGVAYLKSKAYQQRFGRDYGRFLVVTKSQERVDNLVDTTRRFGGGKLFYFTTFEAFSPEKLFYEPIWRNGAAAEPFGLLEKVAWLANEPAASGAGTDPAWNQVYPAPTEED